MRSRFRHTLRDPSVNLEDLGFSLCVCEAPCLSSQLLLRKKERQPEGSAKTQVPLHENGIAPSCNEQEHLKIVGAVKEWPVAAWYQKGLGFLIGEKKGLRMDIICCLSIRFKSV